MRSVAIDGPAGAGKSTIARETAQSLGFIYVDTGALYRSIGLYMLQNEISLESSEEITNALQHIKVELAYVEGEQHVFLNDVDVSDAIRSSEASMAASNVSAVPAVRAFLLELQRDIARKNDVIMDGRDIGTVVLPEANVKIFLTATAEDRARRRHAQLLESGVSVEFDQLLAEIEQRDYNDSNRAIAPLKQADDAMLIDTSGNALEESIELLHAVILNQLGETSR